MKLTAIILLSACLTAGATGFGQTISLSEKNAYLYKVVEKIKKQTDYTFAYTGSQLSQAKKVTIEINKGSLEQVLALCFKDQPFTYTIIERTIVVKPIIEDFNEQATSQPPLIDIKGRVVNENGEPLEGVTVTVKGTKNATATDVNGVFELKSVDENSTLFFSGVNLESYEIKVNGKTEFAVDLKTVFKDAAAASIWGVRAGNGVIVIIPQKGRLKQELRVGVSSNNTFIKKPDLYNIQQISSSGYVDINPYLRRPQITPLFLLVYSTNNC